MNTLICFALGLLAVGIVVLCIWKPLTVLAICAVAYVVGEIGVEERENIKILFGGDK